MFERHRGEHHAGEPADQEHPEEAEHPQHRRLEARTRPLHIVAIQQKNWMPVGIAIMMLAAVKKLAPSCGTPVANMWCTHRPKPMNAVDTSDSTTAR